MPGTRTLLHQLGGMTYVTALDQIMSYYAMDMSKKVWEYLTIILPFGKYQNTKMPMGLKISADVFQREMSKLFEDLSYVLVYINDLLIVTKGSYRDHLEKLKETLKRPRMKGVQLNAKKSFFATQEVEYLGYIINQNGIKRQPKRSVAYWSKKLSGAKKNYTTTEKELLAIIEI